MSIPRAAPLMASSRHVGISSPPSGWCPRIVMHSSPRKEATSNARAPEGPLFRGSHAYAYAYKTADPTRAQRRDFGRSSAGTGKAPSWNLEMIRCPASVSNCSPKAFFACHRFPLIACSMVSIAVGSIVIGGLAGDCDAIRRPAPVAPTMRHNYLIRTALSMNTDVWLLTGA
jgi:hypothetical protein